MKKLLALSMAAMMMAMVAPVKAAEADTGKKDVETTDETSDQKGEIWATLSSKSLSQLKVTMPIRIDFSVTPGTIKDGETEANPTNDFIVGDYKIKVASDSEIGVELTEVTIENAEKGLWTLANAAEIEKTKPADPDNRTDAEKAADQKTVQITIAGKDLDYGKNKITGFEVAKAKDKSLGVKGLATKSVIDPVEAKAELAFNVVYTIKQKDVTETPAS